MIWQGINFLNMDKEIWKDIKGFEGVYQISSHGRLKSFKVNKNGFILKQTNKTKDYFSVVLSKKGLKPKYTRIHRLVAEYFIPNTLNLPQVNHKDLNKQNNHYQNLEWVTGKENVHHALKHKPWMVSAMNNYNQKIRPKKIVQKTKDGIVIDVFSNSIEAFNKTGVCSRNILQVASKDEYKPGLTRKQAGGYKWEYIE